MAITSLGAIGAGLAKLATVVGAGLKAAAPVMLKGAALGAVTNAGTTALQGGSFKDVTKNAAIGAGVGAATGVVGKGLGALGTKVQGLLNIGNKGVATGGAASIETASTQNVNLLPKIETATAGQKANLLPKIETTAPTNITNATAGQTTNNVGTKLKAGLINAKNNLVNNGTNNAAEAANNISAPTPGAGTPAASTPKTFLNNVKTGIVNTAQKAGNAVKNKAGEIGGQVILQGGLSLITAGMGAKTAKEANEVSRQSLLFQQQTYKEQKAEQDKKEVQLKKDAWSAYSSANSFGENLYGNGTNSLLFTKDYRTNPTGNFSILSGNTAKLTDYT